jgi:hypothetical protein
LDDRESVLSKQCRIQFSFCIGLIQFLNWLGATALANSPQCGPGPLKLGLILLSSAAGK